MKNILDDMNPGDLALVRSYAKETAGADGASILPMLADDQGRPYAYARCARGGCPFYAPHWPACNISGRWVDHNGAIPCIPAMLAPDMVDQARADLYASVPEIPPPPSTQPSQSPTSEGDPS